MPNADNVQNNLYLTFRLGEELFALDVAEVREVLDMRAITKVPRTPDFLSGVINVRGSVVPVVDLRTKFGLAQTDDTVNTRIVVMELELDGEQTVFGALADSVHEVTELDPSHIESPPRIGTRWRTDFIRGIGKRNDDFIIILDVDTIFSGEEVQVLEGSSDGMDAAVAGAAQ